MSPFMLGRIFNFDDQAFDISHYQALPDDWFIAIADVVSSTELAQKGRDKDVNFVAAAAVAVLKHQLEQQGDSAAIQFGGDGVIAAIPPEHQHTIRQRLAALAYWSMDLFQISLRIGLVPVADLNEANLPCYVSLQVLDEKNAFGLFLGDGIQAADDWVKQDTRWQLDPEQGDLPGLENLSCRWHPVKSCRGMIASIIIDPTKSGDFGIQQLNEVIQQINQCVSAEQAAPMNQTQALRPPALPSWQSISRELKINSTKSKFSRMLIAYLTSFVLWLAWRVGGKLGNIDAHRYLHSLTLKTDYRKQAGGPRMVLDLTHEEFNTIVELLTEAEKSGKIVYGISTSEASTLTCLVEDFQADNHVHFIDGQGLGFWRASIMLKEKRITRPE
ncbi:MAG: DUF3095 family protein [Oceanospirillales bacterium]|nr:MAG: DUF3095 family protein [Oceanospirillales bacterium]